MPQGTCLTILAIQVCLQLLWETVRDTFYWVMECSSTLYFPLMDEMPPWQFIIFSSLSLSELLIRKKGMMHKL